MLRPSKSLFDHPILHPGPSHPAPPAARRWGLDSGIGEMIAPIAAARSQTIAPFGQTMPRCSQTRPHFYEFVATICEKSAPICKIYANFCQKIAHFTQFDAHAWPIRAFVCASGGLV